MSKILEIEDYLQDKDVFINGISGKPAHMDSYMSIIDFKKLEQAVKKSSFTQKEWKEAAESWEVVSYISPTTKLLSKTIQRWLTDNSFFSN